jgi:hypothetical protein
VVIGVAFLQSRGQQTLGSRYSCWYRGVLGRKLSACQARAFCGQAYLFARAYKVSCDWLERSLSFLSACSGAVSGDPVDPGTERKVTES